jgi:Ca2+-binding EF-hand superfamily protein
MNPDDFDGDGYINKDEFSRAVTPRFSFDVLDADGDGEITAAEYRKGFDMIDQNRDGFITELEFNSVCNGLQTIM